MTGPKKGKPRFFKVLVRDFRKRMSIPPAFVRRFEGRVLVGQTITLECPTGMTWSVKVEDKAGRISFTSGWATFVEGHGLQEGDFVVFELHGDEKMATRIFDNICYGKRIDGTAMQSGVRVKSENVASLNAEGRGDSRNGKVFGCANACS